MKKTIFSRLLITVVWLGVISLLRWRWEWELAGLWAGGVVGTFLLEVDHMLYLVAYPDEPVSFRVREALTARRWQEALAILANTVGERGKLTFHSAFFQVIFWVMCFFVLTSTGSLFGAGLVMAAALRLLVWEFSWLLGGREEELRMKLFWQLAIKPTEKQTKSFVYIMLVVWAGMNLFMI